jgi:hypothetical protein
MSARVAPLCRRFFPYLGASSAFRRAALSCINDHRGLGGR